MNRWVLLKHTATVPSLFEDHFDFLVENGTYCLTWKLYEIPKLNGSLVSIKKQSNHRLFWLTTEQQELTRGRGYVSRVDYGKYLIFENKILDENFSLQLIGNSIRGIFKKQNDFCQLYENI